MLIKFVRKLLKKNVIVSIDEHVFYETLSRYLNDNLYRCTSLTNDIRSSQLHIVSSKTGGKIQLLSCKFWDKKIRHESELVFNLSDEQRDNDYIVATTQNISLSMKLRGLIYGITFIDYPKLAPYLTSNTTWPETNGKAVTHSVNEP